MTPALFFRVIDERNLLLSMEMSFFSWNMGMSFFVVCPLRNCECNAPKIGMNRTEIVLSSSSCNSSRFSGQTSRIYKGIQQKKTSPCSFALSFLGAYDSDAMLWSYSCYMYFRISHVTHFAPTTSVRPLKDLLPHR